MQNIVWRAEAGSAEASGPSRTQVLEGTPPGKQEVGVKLVADIQEGLRRLKGVIDQQDPGKVSFRCGTGNCYFKSVAYLLDCCVMGQTMPHLIC